MDAANRQRGRITVRSSFQDTSRIAFIEPRPLPPVEPKAPRVRVPREAVVASRARRARDEARAPYAAGELPPGWAAVVDDELSTTNNSRVSVPWHDVTCHLAGALCERGCPLRSVEAVIARWHMADPTWSEHLADRMTAARTTVARYINGEPVTGYERLREVAPAVAAALDRGLAQLQASQNSPVVQRVRARLAVEGPAPISADEASKLIAQEIRDARGLVVIAAPPGTGKTQGVLAVVRELPPLPPLPEHAKPGARIGYTAPTYKLLEQTAGQAPSAQIMRSPLAHLTDGKPTCKYAAAARELARGGQSVGYELCRGRDKNPCRYRSGCAAAEVFEGDDRATFVGGVHQLTGYVQATIGTCGRLVVDEPRELLVVEPITIDDMTVALRRGDAFESDYEAPIRPFLYAVSAYIEQVGVANAECLTRVADMVRATAAYVPLPTLEAAKIDPSPGPALADRIIRTALYVLTNKDGTPSRDPPPLRRYEAGILCSKGESAPERGTGTASRVRLVLRKGLMDHHAGRVADDSGERALSLVGTNEYLAKALGHTAPVILLDANAKLMLVTLRRVWPDLRFIDLAVRDGARIARTILACAYATYSELAPNGVPRWERILPLLRAALAWLAEDPSTQRAGLFLPKSIEVGIAYALSPTDPETVKLVRESRSPAKTLEAAAKLLRPLLATWSGELVLGHHGALRGRDDWKDCDATVTIGDPRPHLGAELEKAMFLGLTLDERCELIAAGELQQAHGRLRTPHRTRPGRQAHVGDVVPAGWEGREGHRVEVRPLPVGRPRTLSAMDAGELAAIRAWCGISERAFADALGVSARTVARYLDCTGTIPLKVAEAARGLAPDQTKTPLGRDSVHRGFCRTPDEDAATGVSAAPLPVPATGVSAARPAPLRAASPAGDETSRGAA